VFDCKPLAFIWAKFPEHYDEHNTIMMDDLRCAGAGLGLEGR
jgi:ubiquitin-like domain-containing CTD phosphatase 1